MKECILDDTKENVYIFECCTKSPNGPKMDVYVDREITDAYYACEKGDIIGCASTYKATIDVYIKVDTGTLEKLKQECEWYSLVLHIEHSNGMVVRSDIITGGQAHDEYLGEEDGFHKYHITFNEAAIVPAEEHRNDFYFIAPYTLVQLRWYFYFEGKHDYPLIYDFNLKV